MISRRKIIFRADGNVKIGLGHLYRLLAIKEMIGETMDYVFVSKDSTIKHLSSHSIPHFQIPKNVSLLSEPIWLSKFFKPAEYLVIADGYLFANEYQKGLINIGYKLIYIDDLAKEMPVAHLTVNHTPGITHKAYSGINKSKVVCGSKFVLLRELFLNTSRLPKQLGSLDKVLICFGGSDHKNLALKFIRALLSLNAINEIHVVMGRLSSVNEIAEIKNRNLFLHINQSQNDIVSLMRKCGLAILPTSTICYEACAVGTLIFGGFYVPNQLLYYNNLCKKKVIFAGGDFTRITEKHIQKEILRIIKMSSSKKEQVLKNQTRLVDGKSGLRIKRLIESLISFD